MEPPGPALFVISIDLEMSWGAMHHGGPHDASPYGREREAVADALAAMERHGISATWAVVGHLFLEECAVVHGRKHPGVVRPHYSWFEGDWYDLDPCGSYREHPTWYGPDLITAIRSSSTPQEIGSHSFGHIIVGDPGCSREAFATDLEACHQVARTDGLELRSFVYPRNSIGHVDVLAQSGFSVFRGPTPERFVGMPDWRRRVLAIADQIRPLRSTAVFPAHRGGLIDVPQTYLFDPGSRAARILGTKAWSMLVRRRLRHAVRTSSLFHMWFHTHNLATARERARVAMDAVFAEARTHIDAGRLNNVTMGQLAERTGGEACDPSA